MEYQADPLEANTADNQRELQESGLEHQTLPRNNQFSPGLTPTQNRIACLPKYNSPVAVYLQAMRVQKQGASFPRNKGLLDPKVVIKYKLRS